MGTNVERYAKHFDRQVEQRLIKEGKIVVDKVQTGDSVYHTMNKTKPDGYGGFVKITSTSFWEREDYDDGSFIVRQLNAGVLDKVIRFGPLTTTINQLYAMGFTLSIESFTHRKKHSLVLRRDKEEYKLATIFTSDLAKYEDLTMHVRDQSEPDYRSSMASAKEETKQEPHVIIREVEKEVIKEIRIETDPFEELMLRYPVTRKSVEFVGNQTISEYVKQQLKENRRLQYVE